MSSCCMLMWFSFVSILWRFQRGDVLHTSLGRSLHLPPAFRSSPDSLSHNHSSFDQLLHHTIGKDGGQSSLFLISGWCRQSKKGGCRTLQSLQTTLDLAPTSSSSSRKPRASASCTSSSPSPACSPPARTTSPSALSLDTWDSPLAKPSMSQILLLHYLFLISFFIICDCTTTYTLITIFQAVGLILAVDSGHQSVKSFSSALAKKANQGSLPDAQDLLQVPNTCVCSVPSHPMDNEILACL